MRTIAFILLGCLVLGGLAMSISSNKLPSSYTEKNRPEFYKETIRIKKKKGSMVSFRVETSKSSRQLAYGLMFKRKLAKNEGMIFVFPKDHKASFWMKNTFIPLDIIFINRAGEITQIEQGKPHDLTQIKSKVNVRYALEVKRGQALEQGIRVGDKLLLPK